MLDFVLGAYFAGLAMRGWFRGLIRESLDLAGVLVGVIFSLRLATPLGDFLSDRFGWTPETSVLAGGAGLFVLLGVGGGWLASMLSRFTRLSGLTLANRVGGLALAATWGLVVVFVVVTLARGLPLSEGVDDALDRSRVLAFVEPVQDRFVVLAGDRVVGAIAALESIGNPRLVPKGNESITVPPSTDFRNEPEDARLVLELINRHRLEAGVDPLAWSDSLAEVARRHAEEMYSEGYLSHRSPRTGAVGDRLADAQVDLTETGELICLAASSRATYAGLAEVENQVLVASRFDRAGLVAISGPNGLLVVGVLAG